MADFQGMLSQLLSQSDPKQKYAERMNTFIKLVASGLDPLTAMQMSGFQREFSMPATTAQGLDAMNTKGRLEGIEPSISAENTFLYPSGGNYTEMAKKLRQPVIKNPPPKSGIID